MISVPMKQARRHSELTKHQREPLSDHFKECCMIIQKRSDMIEKMTEREQISKEDYTILYKVIGNTSFYHKLAQKFGDYFSKAVLKNLKYEVYKRGDLIIKEGANCLNTYFILSGVIKIDNQMQTECNQAAPSYNIFTESQLFNKISIGSSFGYLPEEIALSKQSFEAFSSLVELAVIDINCLKEIKIEAENLCNNEKLKFFKEQMPELFEGIDKKSAQLFFQLIKETYVKRGELITTKLKQPNCLCVISKGQIMSDYGIEIERERIKSDGIDISDRREIKKRHYCTQILVRGDVFIINGKGEKSKNIIGTHMRIKEKLVSTSFITQIYYCDDQEYENILASLRDNMRFEILVEDDNLKYSQKILSDFQQIYKNFLEKQKDLKTQITGQIQHTQASSEIQMTNGYNLTEQDSEIEQTKKCKTIDQNDFRRNDKIEDFSQNQIRDVKSSYQFSRLRRNTINVPSNELKNSQSYQNSKKGYNNDSCDDFEYQPLYYFDKQDVNSQTRHKKANSQNINQINTQYNSSFIDGVLQNSIHLPKTSSRKVVVVSTLTNQQNTQNLQQSSAKQNIKSKSSYRSEYNNTEQNLMTDHGKNENSQSCQNYNIPTTQKKANMQKQVLKQLVNSGKKVQNLFQLQQQMQSKRNRAVSQFVQNITSDYGYTSHISTESQDDSSFANGFNTLLKRRNTNNSLSETKKIRENKNNISYTNGSTRQNSSNKKSYNLYGQFDDELENLVKCKNQILKKCKKDQKEFDKSSKQISKTHESADIDYVCIKKKQILDQANKEIIKKRVEEKENLHNDKKIYKKAEKLNVPLFSDMSDVIRARVSRMFKNKQTPLINSYI